MHTIPTGKLPKKALLLISLFCVAVFSVAGAQSQPFGTRDMNSQISLGDAYMLPKIYATNLTFAQSNGAVHGTFSVLSKEDSVVPNITYRFELLSKDLTSTTFDIQPSGQTLLLNSQEQKTINFVYALPKNIAAGTYDLRVHIETTEGRLLGWDDKPITLKASGQTPIDMSNLQFTASEYAGKTFEALSGPNVTSSKNFSINATVKNNTKKSVTFTPSVNIYNFDLIKGNPVATQAKAVTVLPGKTTDINIPLTAQSQAGVYFATLKLLDASGNSISSMGQYRWVVRGESAGIMPIKFSTLKLNKGDKNSVNIDFYGSPDAETVKVGALNVQLTDSKGLVSSFYETKLPLNDKTYPDQVNLINSRNIADNPTLHITLQDQDNNTLYQSATNLVNAIGPISPSVPVVKSNDNSWFSSNYLLIIILLIAIILVAIISTRMKNKFKNNATTVSVIVLLILSASLMSVIVNPSIAKATDTSAYCPNNSSATIDYVLAAGAYPRTQLPSNGSGDGKVFNTSNASVTTREGDVVLLSGYRIGLDQATDHYTDDELDVSTNLGTFSHVYGNACVAGGEDNYGLVTPFNITNLFAPGSNSARFVFKDLCGSLIQNTQYYLDVVHCTPTCTQNASQRCAGNAVYNFDSCGVQGSLSQACTANQTCSNAQCINTTSVCTPNATQRCSGNTLISYDSCGVQGTSQTCQYGCANNACNTTPVLLIQTNPASNILSNSATLNGYLSNLGLSPSASVWFQWGTTTSYGFETVHQTLQLQGPFNQSISGLNPNTVYHFRAAAQNGTDGLVYGQDMSFVAGNGVTGAQVQTLSATNIQPNAAVLNGQVLSLGGDSSGIVYFQWGTSVAYGFQTPSMTMQTTDPFNQTITGLTPTTSYQFRAVVQTTSGVVYGANMSFTTNAGGTGYVIVTPTPVCTTNAYQRCMGNNLYWYDSCGNQLGVAQACSNGCYGNACSAYNNNIVTTNYNYQHNYNNDNNNWYHNGYNNNYNYNYNNNNNCYNGNCNNNNCTDYSYKQCVGNSVYWYNSCGNQQGIFQTCAANSTCQNNQCVNNYTPAPTPVVPTYYPHYYTQCYGNNIYWRDSNGALNSFYKTCNDSNSCTVDSCAAKKCSNILKCDGSTCATGSADYTKYCSANTNNNPNSNNTTGSNGLVVTFFVKPTESSAQWQKTIEMGPNGTSYFMVTVANNSDATMNNVNISTNIPGQITSVGNVKVDGTAVSGDIISGINLGTLAQNSSKTITFEGKTQGFTVSAQNQQATAAVNTNGSMQSDSLSISFNPNATSTTAAVSSAKSTNGLLDFLKRWYLWILVALVLIFLFVVVFRRLSSTN